MIEVKNEYKCSGCCACMNVCPVDAISMKEDFKGFLIPFVDFNLCVKCSKCEDICPFHDKNVKKNTNFNKIRSKIQKSYAAYNIDKESRADSSSGAIFPLLAEYILQQGGVVAGVALDRQFMAYHKIIDSKVSLKDLQGSKYVQSSIRYNYRDIKKILNSGRMVLFTGTACQVEGLYAYLGQEYSNLFTLDIICMGIPSPKVWQTYLNIYFKNQKINYINFKDKNRGWTCFSFVVDTDKRKVNEIGKENSYMRLMFNHISIRPSCFQCCYKTNERHSDLTLADCWGYDILVSNKLFDNKGLSSIFVHSEKGEAFLNNVKKHLVITEISWDEAIKHNENMVTCIAENASADKFYKKLNLHPSRLLFILYSKNYIEKLKRVVKKILKV